MSGDCFVEINLRQKINLRGFVIFLIKYRELSPLHRFVWVSFVGLFVSNKYQNG